MTRLITRRTFLRLLGTAFFTVEGNLIVSGGLGFSILPVRFGVRPEILPIELGA